MKYLCLVYQNEAMVDALCESEWRGLVDECLDFGDRLRRCGQFLGGEALQAAHTATTVRTRDGKVTVTDGPFAETKEQLAGFYLVEARDLNEAIQVASRIPPARYGSIEVRPVREMVPSAGAEPAPADEVRPLQTTGDET